jgi:hypothetical protein
MCQICDNGVCRDCTGPCERCVNGICRGCDPNCETCNESTGACETTCPNRHTCCVGACIACCGPCDPVRGVCTDAEGTACVGNKDLCCGGKCVESKTDRNNCGFCGNVCPPESTCVGGECKCEGTKFRCGNRCVDLQTDLFNCGSCGRACGSSETCVNGQCTGGRVCNPPCTPERQCCPSRLFAGGNDCVDLSRNQAYCGSCFVSCEGSAAFFNPLCQNGTCVCSGGELCAWTSTDGARGTITLYGSCDTRPSHNNEFCDSTRGCVRRS